MGNSEVGHLTMGAGYAEPQSLEVIDRSIADGTFFANAALRAACAAARAGQTLHLMGLLSTGGVHADMRHLAALIELAKREDVKNVVVHAFLDGRDMPPRSAMPLLGQVGAPIATVHGRFYAMDRDKRWDRTLRECYRSAECKDELLEPCVVGTGHPIADRDAVIFFNFRPDRARQLTWALMDPSFTGFARPRVPRDLTFVTMTDYQVELPVVRVAFAPREVTSLAELLAAKGLKQLHIAETEKYAHVTYFFNGGREEPFPGEDRVLVPSPKVTTYDLAPEMSAAPVASKLVDAVRTGTYDFAIVNFANPDMVGHTGVFAAALRAMAATDAAVGEVVDAVLAAGGCMLLTADHGNAEEMRFPDGGANTQHSTDPVPVVFISTDPARWTIRDGELSDIAPSILGLLGLPVPPRMTGRSLLARR
jgi:2,3-bisphosphoglycerate-independent phosphoglycerate mutase